MTTTLVTCEAIPYSASNNGIMVSKERPEIVRFTVDTPLPELPPDEKIQKWNTGSITVNTFISYLSCHECKEDIDKEEHYPGEQRCQQCRYITCWRAFQEHQQQIYNERPKTSLIVPSPLINIPLERKLQCLCGYTSNDSNRLARHLINVKKHRHILLINTVWYA
nr:PREDICTED: uncharacterized protein LOC105668544 [Linepithema humile]